MKLERFWQGRQEVEGIQVQAQTAIKARDSFIHQNCHLCHLVRRRVCFQRLEGASIAPKCRVKDMCQRLSGLCHLITVFHISCCRYFPCLATEPLVSSFLKKLIGWIHTSRKIRRFHDRTSSPDGLTGQELRLNHLWSFTQRARRTE